MKGSSSCFSRVEIFKFSAFKDANLLFCIAKLLLAMFHQRHAAPVGSYRCFEFELAAFHALNDGFELGERGSELCFGRTCPVWRTLIRQVTSAGHE